MAVLSYIYLYYNSDHRSFPIVFLLPTFVRGMVRSLGYWRAEYPRWQRWLRSVSVLCSGIVLCVPTCRRWNSVNKEKWKWRYYLASIFTTILSIGAFLLATFVLGMVGSLCWWRADNPRVQWWLRSLSVFCFDFSPRNQPRLRTSFEVSLEEHTGRNSSLVRDVPGKKN